MSQTLPIIPVRGVCPHDCPDTCGWVVDVDTTTGKAVRMRGDADHPFTKGHLCQKVANYLERVYHPERLATPLRRTGPKGSGQFEPISWEVAIQTIAERFQAIMDSEHGPQAILPYSYAGTMGKLQFGSLDRRFFHRIGASLLDRTICASAGAAGCEITLGTRAVIDPEQVRQSKLIINWGSNTKVTNVHLWTIMHQARKAGAKIVTIDPYRSQTAAASDWWIAIRPGTDGALALGMMHILFRDGLIDTDYLERHCIGTEELKNRVLAEYPPGRVAKITGLVERDIELLALEYGKAPELYGGPAFIRLNYGLQRHGGGAMAVRTICCLPAIIGSWKSVGGGALLSTSKQYPFNEAFLTRPDLIPPGTRTINMTQLAEALQGELPGPPVLAMMVYNSNPAAVCPDQSRVLAGLQRDDLFTVVHDQFLTDTAKYADIVLPATTQLEHFDIHNSYGHLYLQLNHAAIAPFADAKPNTDVFRMLGRAMKLEEELFTMPDEELARRSLLPGQAAQIPLSEEENQLAGTAFQGLSWERLQKEGPLRLNLPTHWLPFANGNFGTESGKCEFYSDRELRAGRDPLPHYIPPHEDPQTQVELALKYPLQLITPPEASFLNSTFVNVDTLRKKAKEAKVVMNEIDARDRQLEAGQLVRVWNDRGSYMARLEVGQEVRAGVVVAFGIWWNRYTHDQKNVNTLTSTALTDQGGGATFFDSLVEVGSNTTK